MLPPNPKATWKESQMTGEGGKEEWEAARGVRVCQVVQRVPSQQRKTLVFPGDSPPSPPTPPQPCRQIPASPFHR